MNLLVKGRHTSIQSNIFLLVVIILSFFTYFYNYQNPSALFWDENYHIPSAHKYLDGVFFMEHHPPLGKMLIALGEKILQPNRGVDTTYFLETDYITSVPERYSFAGVRFFPALFAWLAAPIFFLILLEISKKPFLSLLFSSVYIFENAIIVHSRGAMLEGSQMFFVLLSIYIFLKLWRKATASLVQYGLLGLVIGIATAIKLNSLILFLLPAVLLLREMAWPLNWLSVNELAKKGVVFLMTFSLVFSAVFYVHFALGKRVIDDRYYESPPKVQDIVREGATADIRNFPTLLKEAFVYTDRYEKGVPAYDVCKPDENGSPPLLWPFGVKSINYRWEQSDGGIRYLYLQGNPIIWGMGLLGIGLSFSLILSHFIFKLKVTNKRLFTLIVTFTSMYVLYMMAVFHVTRVLYLYHYFIPLLLSLIIFFLLLLYRFDHLEVKSRGLFYGTAVALVFLVFVTFHFFSPLTYYQALTHNEFAKRIWFLHWKLMPIPESQ